MSDMSTITESHDNSCPERRGSYEEFVGNIAVDSGHIMIVDPCYMVDHDKPGDMEWYDAQGERIDEGPRQTTGLHTGDFDGAVITPTAWGDGLYPTFATFDSTGRITEIRVVFD